MMDIYCLNKLGAHYCSRGLCSSKLKRIALALEDLDAAVDVGFVETFNLLYLYREMCCIACWWLRI